MNPSACVLFTAAVAAACVGTVGSAGASPRAGAPYTIRLLGTLGGPTSVAYGVNERGQVLGDSDVSSTDSEGEPYQHVFLWERGLMHDLGTLGGTESTGSDINDAGQVVGASTTRARARHAFLWSNGRMRDLGTLGGRSSQARDVNERGEVVGSSGTGKGTTHAFLWQKGRMIDLGTLPGGRSSSAVAINDRGQVVGTSGTRSGWGHAFLWSNGHMTDLGTLGGKDVSSRAVAVTGRGVVLVVSSHGVGDPDNEGHEASFPRSFLWKDGVVTRIGSRDGFDEATAMNEAGQVVGQSYPEYGLVRGGDATGFLWGGGTKRALDLYPSAIGARGAIVGESAENGAVAMYRSQAGTTTALGDESRTDTGAWALNERGWVVGSSWSHAGDGPTAALWVMRRP